MPSALTVRCNRAIMKFSLSTWKVQIKLFYAKKTCAMPTTMPMARVVRLVTTLCDHISFERYYISKQTFKS